MALLRRPLVPASLLVFVGFVGCASFSGSETELSPDASTGGSTPDTGAASPDAGSSGASGTSGGSSGITCGAHQRATGDQCACAPGFTDQGAGCVWTGVLRDPELVGDPPDAWTLENGTIEPENGGRARFMMLGSIAQEIELPTLEEVGGALSLQTDLIGQIMAQEISMRGAELQSVLAPSTNLSTCLGEGVMGKTLRLQATVLGRLGGVPQPWYIGSMQIAPDPACPLPGQMPNGDFESVGAWSTLPFFGATYDIAANRGVAGSVGASITTDSSCQAALQRLISIPSRPTALEYAVQGAGTRYIVAVGARKRVRTATAVYEAERTCIPRALLGQTATLSFETPGSCSSFQLAIDDVRLVDDPSCAEADVPSGDFESSNALETWIAGSQGGVTRTTNTGGYGLALARSFECDAPVVNTTIDVPVPTGTNRLVLRYSSVGPNGVSRVSGTVGGLLSGQSFAFEADSSGAPVSREICLPVGTHGGMVPLTIRHEHAAGSSTCANPDNTRVVLDDFRIEEVVTCP